MVTKTTDTKKVPAAVRPSPSQDPVHLACQAHTLASYLYNQMALAHPWTISHSPPMGMGSTWISSLPAQPWHAGPGHPYFGPYPMEAHPNVPFHPNPFGFYPR
ncbi:MAG: hypothetical protein PVF68_07860 [Acidobacteriota bacterium]|jgi:hypothetical protein